MTRQFMPEELVTAKEAADMLKINRTTLLRMHQKGLIVGYKLSDAKTATRIFYLKDVLKLGEKLGKI